MRCIFILLKYILTKLAAVEFLSSVEASDKCFDGQIAGCIEASASRIRPFECHRKQMPPDVTDSTDESSHRLVRIIPVCPRSSTQALLL